MKIDINCDMGESFGRYRLGMDDQAARLVSSANLACGFHAADPLVMDSTLRLCAKHGVAVGAHPGHFDLRGFGRRAVAAGLEEIRTDVLYQIGALHALARALDLKLSHVKPHGALYNQAAADAATAGAVARAVAQFDASLVLVTLAGPGGAAMRQAGRDAGLRVAGEAFADRAYLSDGTLAPRSEPGAVIQNPREVADRCLRMATEGVVVATDGTVLQLAPQTICVHGDNPEALEILRLIRRELDQAGVSVLPMGELL